jgi:hypothetical protein
MADQLAQRLAGDGADVLLELRDRRAVERPVSAIMHPRRDLVDRDFRAAIPLHHEYLDREHTDVIQRVGDLSQYAAMPISVIAQHLKVGDKMIVKGSCLARPRQ